MVKINTKVKEENVDYEVGDCLLLTHKNEGNLCLAIIIECCIDSKKRYDLTILGGNKNRDFDFTQWNNFRPYKSIEGLINSVEEFYEVTKLKQNQYEIIVNIK